MSFCPKFWAGSFKYFHWERYSQNTLDPLFSLPANNQVIEAIAWTFSLIITWNYWNVCLPGVIVYSEVYLILINDANSLYEWKIFIEKKCMSWMRLTKWSGWDRFAACGFTSRLTQIDNTVTDLLGSHTLF